MKCWTVPLPEADTVVASVTLGHRTLDLMSLLVILEARAVVVGSERRGATYSFQKPLENNFNSLTTSQM